MQYRVLFAYYGFYLEITDHQIPCIDVSQNLFRILREESSHIDKFHERYSTLLAQRVKTDHDRRNELLPQGEGNMFKIQYDSMHIIDLLHQRHVLECMPEVRRNRVIKCLKKICDKVRHMPTVETIYLPVIAAIEVITHYYGSAVDNGVTVDVAIWSQVLHNFEPWHGVDDESKRIARAAFERYDLQDVQLGRVLKHQLDTSGPAPAEANQLQQQQQQQQQQHQPQPQQQPPPEQPVSPANTNRAAVGDEDRRPGATEPTTNADQSRAARSAELVSNKIM